MILKYIDDKIDNLINTYQQNKKIVQEEKLKDKELDIEDI